MNDLPKRKPLRMKNYDYSQNGCYFVTICTHNREKILSNVCRGGVLLRPLGKIIQTEICELSKRYGVEIAPYVIMPDHIHMLIRICNAQERAEQSPAPTIGDMICAFKSLTTKTANKKDNCAGRKIWQRGYYEHIIRNETDYLQTAEYIETNPLGWELRENESPVRPNTNSV